jgi:hypothetical protein
MRPDRLSELFDSSSLTEIVEKVGSNETLTIEVSKQKGIKVSRQTNITFWQGIFAATWFPLVAAIIAVAIWKVDESGVVIRYVRENLAVTVTGLFAAWLLGARLVVYLFRYIRRS